MASKIVDPNESAFVVNFSEEELISSENVSWSNHNMEDDPKNNNFIIFQSKPSKVPRARCHICAYCGKEFSEKRAFRQHELTHTEAYPFICPMIECKKKFITQGKMMDHIRDHTGETQYICCVCAKPFSARRKLLQHEKRFHKLLHSSPSAVYGPRVKKHPCDRCHLKFATSLNLEWHVENYHIKGLTTTCVQCGTEYKEMSALRRHIKEKHENMKKFQCQYCKKSFSQKAVLIGHERTHTGEKPYPCDFCPFMYPTKSALTNHTKKAHFEE